MFRYLIFGKGRSGRAASLLLSKRGIPHRLVDDGDPLWRSELRKAQTVVVSPGIPPRHAVFKLASLLKKELIGETELAYRFWRGSVVAVTGTDGKSTATRLAYLVLSSTLPSVFEGGNTGVPFSELVAKGGSGLAVLEVSSFQGYTLRFFRPQAGAFLNFAPDHLDWHTDLDDYLRGKYRIFHRQRPGDLLILNGSDERVLETPSAARKVLFDHPAGEVRIRPDGRVYLGDLLLFEGRKVKLKGAHNLRNAAVAAVLGLEFGVPLKRIREVLYSFEGLPYRLQYLGRFAGARFYNDSKSTTPNALRAALEAVEGPVVLVFGGKDKGADFSPLRGLFKRKVWRALAFGENAPKLKETFGDLVEVKVLKNLEEVFGELRKLPLEGKTVLFSPGAASFDLYSSYAERGEHFNRLVEEFFGRPSRGGGT
ncbi:MAG: UDP-N-acetylmuramoyl-L-alanine--D-glutamate ligase [Aquificae bacterium]|nr:UDP-N-acetylmuramoyl-L-alanine--D-glutamate ligase [Aquificota bacterium]